jgi:hypothetical protein
MGALLAAAALRASGAEAAAIDVYTASSGVLPSGGTTESGMRMQEEESEERRANPWLVVVKLQPKLAGTPPLGRSLPKPFVDDYDEVGHDEALGDSIHLTPSFLGKGNVRMLRASAARLRSYGEGHEPRLLAPSAGSALAIRERAYHREKMMAHFSHRASRMTPEQTKALVAQGKMPKVGEGPTPAQSLKSTFTDFAVAYASVPGGGGAPKAAHCRTRAPQNKGYGIGCGYAGSAYCLLTCALSVRAAGGVPPERCGAGLSPGSALDFDEYLSRLKMLGYEFETAPRALAATDLDAAHSALEKANPKR